MNLLAGYDSEDNEAEENAAVPVQLEVSQSRVVPIATLASSSSTSRHVRPINKKKFDMSVLPPDIVAALTRGDSTFDSDEENDSVPSHSKITKVDKKSEPSPNDFSSLLLKLLPAPKEKSTNSTSVNSFTSVTDIKPNDQPVATNSIKQSPFNFTFTAVSTSTASTLSEKNHLKHPVISGNKLVSLINTTAPLRLSKIIFLVTETSTSLQSSSQCPYQRSPCSISIE